MTELEVVNDMLREVGSTPVNTLESTHPDVHDAKALLDRIQRQVQRKGWWFNTEYDITLTPDVDDEISVSNDVVFIQSADAYNVLRGNKVFNKENNTYKFDDSIQVYQLIRILAWEQLPELVTEYCRIIATMEFVRRQIGDNVRVQELKEDAVRALIDITAINLRSTQTNMFNSTAARKVKVGVVPYGARVPNFSERTY